MQYTDHHIRNSQTSEDIFLRPIDQQYQDSKSENCESEEDTIENDVDFFDEYEQGKNMEGIFYIIDKLNLSTDVESINGATRHNSLKEGDDYPSFKKRFNLNFTTFFLCEDWKSNLKQHIKDRQTYYLSKLSQSFICSKSIYQISSSYRHSLSQSSYDQLNAYSPYYMSNNNILSKSDETYTSNLNSSNIQKTGHDYNSEMMVTSIKMINPFNVKSIPS